MKFVQCAVKMLILRLDRSMTFGSKRSSLRSAERKVKQNCAVLRQFPVKMHWTTPHRQLCPETSGPAVVDSICFLFNWFLKLFYINVSCTNAEYACSLQYTKQSGDVRQVQNTYFVYIGVLRGYQLAYGGPGGLLNVAATLIATCKLQCVD